MGNIKFEIRVDDKEELVDDLETISGKFISSYVGMVSFCARGLSFLIRTPVMSL